MIEQDETPRAAALVRGGDRINFEMVYFRRMCGGGEGKGRLVYLGRLLQTRPHPGWKFQKGAFDRIGGRAEEEEESCVVIRGKRARARMRVREVTC